MADVFAYDLGFTSPSGQQTSLGRLAIKREGARVQSAFRFAADYLSHQGLPDLCPIHLPAREGTFPCLDGIHPVFEDMVPDVWGKGLLRKAYGLVPRDSIPAIYLGLVDDPVGALSVQGVAGNCPVQRRVPSPVLPIEETMQLSLALEAGELLDPHLLRQLVRSGSSGGARPKAMSVFHGKPCLFKFVSREDTFSMIRAESVCMAVAAQIGLEPPPTWLIELCEKPVFVLERFDMTASQGRNHMISMKTALNLVDPTQGSYLEMANCLRTVVADPVRDIGRLFRQMIFNVLVGNIDDHMKNFALLHTVNGWQLANAYDITPAAMQNPEGSRWHSIQFDPGSTDPYDPSAQNWAGLGRRFGLGNTEISHAIDEVIASISLLEYYATSNEMPEKDWNAWHTLMKARADLLTRR